MENLFFYLLPFLVKSRRKKNKQTKTTQNKSEMKTKIKAKIKAPFLKKGDFSFFVSYRLRLYGLLQT